MERCDEGAVNLSSGRETTERSSMKDEEVKVPPQFPPTKNHLSPKTISFQSTHKSLDFFLSPPLNGV